MNKICVVGRTNIDFICTVDKYPPEDSKISFYEKFTEGGGQGSTASCCIAHLGGAVDFFSIVGTDHYGEFCINKLKDFNINTDTISRSHISTTPVSYIFVNINTGARTIFYEQSSLPSIDLTDSLKHSIVSADYILLDPSVHHLAEYLAAINPKGSIIYDCERMKEGTDMMIQLADYLVPSKDFLYDDSLNIKGHTLSERIINLSSNIPGQLIVTAGEDGAYFVHESYLYHVTSPKVLVKDTTGAGDNFHGALTLALAQNMEIGDAVMFAVAIASLSCQDYGSRSGLPQYAKALHIARGLTITRTSI